MDVGQTREAVYAGGMTDSKPIPACLSIAGSDSGGGAGIQADLKAFARCGVHGMTAITGLTAQNTLGVEMVTATPPEMIVAQVRAVADDIGVDAVKIGMLGDEPTIDAVVEALDLVGDSPVVVDPVMVSQSGAVLLDPNAKAALIERVLPRAAVATPNLHEARELACAGPSATAAELAEEIQALGPAAVIVTGGHGEDGADVLYDGAGCLRIEGPRYADGASHGSGDTHSSALAAFLARGEGLADAARWAREIASEAVGNGLRDLGAGAGPVDVFGLAREAASGRRGPLPRPPARDVAGES
jgi:hydroxymethylpyrimidine/phosphomethylpyrimidine kinase